MAQLGGTFDATQVDPNAGPPLVPEAKYLVHIIASDMKVTKDRTGQYLQVEMEILEGPFIGKKVFDRLNLQNNSDQTVQIAQRTLSQICHAVGVMSVSDSEQLHARRMIIDVRVEKGKGNYRDQNRVFSYHPVNDTVAAGAAAPAQQFAPAPVGGAAAPTPLPQRTATPPWRTQA